jgi:electron transfer flavoprotein beta subunit
MRIAVIVKEVPDTEARIVIGADGKPDLSGVKWIVNPYDDYAIEEAITQAQAHGATVTAIMIGNDDSRANLTQVLALGADDAVLIEDQMLSDSDGIKLAKALAAAVRSVQADMVFAGRQGVDYDWGLTGIALAEDLGWAHVGLISKLEVKDKAFRAESEGDAGKLVTEGALPAVFTVDKGINEPRLPSLKGIMAAKKKTISVSSLADLGLTEDDVDGNKAVLVGAEYPPAKAPGRIIEGASVQEKVAKLVEALRSEAKVI